MAKTKQDKTPIVVPDEPILYKIHGRELILTLEIVTGARYDKCLEVARSVENAVLTEDGFLSISGLTSKEWGKFLSAIFIDVDVKKWTIEYSDSLEKWFAEDGNFPNPNLLGEIVQNFTDANAGWFGGSARLWKLRNRLLDKGLDAIALLQFQNPEQKLNPIKTPN